MNQDESLQFKEPCTVITGQDRAFAAVLCVNERLCSCVIQARAPLGSHEMELWKALLSVIHATSAMVSINKYSMLLLGSHLTSLCGDLVRLNPVPARTLII